jgi:hypothetical protein
MWVLASSVAGAEFTTRAKLDEIGVTVWVPVYRKRVPSRFRRKPKIVHFPLFSRYMFVCTEDVGATRALIRARATQVWILSAGRDRGPLEIGYKDVNDLMRREDNNEFDMLDRNGPTRLAVKLGEIVILCGAHPLEGRSGTVEARLANGERYRIGVNGLVVTAGVDQIRRPNGHANGDGRNNGG